MAVSKEERTYQLKNRKANASIDGVGISPLATDMMDLSPKDYSINDISKIAIDRGFQVEHKKNSPIVLNQPVQDSQFLRKKRLDALRLGMYSTMVSGKYGTGKAV